MRPLVIGNNEKERLKQVKEYAETHPFSVDDILDMMNRELGGAGTDPNHQCIIPFDYQVIFTVENQPHGTVRHLSMSVPGRGRFPNPHACQMVMDELGFLNKIDGGKCEVKVIEDKIHIAERI